MSKEIFKGDSVGVVVKDDGSVDVVHYPVKYKDSTSSRVRELADELGRLHKLKSSPDKGQLLHGLLEKFDSEVGNVSTEIAEWAKTVTEIAFNCEPVSPRGSDFQIRVEGYREWLFPGDFIVLGENADVLYAVLVESPVMNACAPAAPAAPVSMSDEQALKHSTSGGKIMRCNVYQVNKYDPVQYRRVIYTWHVVNTKEGILMKSDCDSYEDADSWIGKNNLREVAKVRKVVVPL